MTTTTRPAVTQDPQSWQLGYDAGLAGHPAVAPLGVDELAFLSGWLEGDADRLRGIDRRKISARTGQ